MQIRTKVTVTLALLFAVLIAAQWLIEEHQILPPFVELERESARTDMQRVVMALEREERALTAQAGDWANWNDLWQFVDGHPIRNQWKTLQQVPAKTAISDAMSKDLKKRGFKFVGSTICYAFMQAVGMVNDHVTDCFRYKEVLK